VSSAIGIYLKQVSKPDIKPCCEYTERKNSESGKPKYDLKFSHGIPAYALFSGKGKNPSERKTPEDEPANVILRNLKFELKIQEIRSPLSDADWHSVLEAVRWWANFGGLGARTRRGLGSIAVSGVEPLTNRCVESFGAQLKTLTQTDNATEAWQNAIIKLETFRQGRNIARQPGNGKQPGRSFWPEPDSIRLITGNTANGYHPPVNRSGTFPRAAFGLPIIFDFNVPESKDEPPKSELTPAGDLERMASPLIVKAQYLGDEQYRAIALLLPHEHLENLSVKLKFIDYKLHHQSRFEQLATRGRTEKNPWWPKDKNQQQELARDIKPLVYAIPCGGQKAKDGNDCDALTAFMNYFDGKD
ncbi:MAG: hypothetical protein CTY24_12550, partial [Methylobacter sp.]